MSDSRRRIPSVDRLLSTPAFLALSGRFPRARVVGGLRSELERLRRAAAAEGDAEAPEPEALAEAVEARLLAEEVPSLRRVINATGVLLHTNLGRAPLPAVAARAMAEAAAGYSTLEYDPAEGVRGSRYVHCAELLQALTGAEAGLVVNNNAAALVLALNTVAQGRAVLVSRGELVEIGGGFRVPEILERSGARLREVGSTNRTRAEDYAQALTPEVGAILKVHRSNFRISGFTGEVEPSALAELARGAGVPLLHDLGTGLLLDGVRLGLPGEPSVRDSLSWGTDLVTFSGDKLLGGPQAGVVVGRAALVERMKRNPLCRALRVDKVTLAGLEATLRLYRDPERALQEIPVLARLLEPAESLALRARELAERLLERGATVEVAAGEAVVGGGTCPGVEIPSWTLRLAGGEAAVLARRLRERPLPVVARTQDGQVVLDLRTVLPGEEELLAEAVLEALGQAPGGGLARVRDAARAGARDGG